MCCFWHYIPFWQTASDRSTQIECSPLLEASRPPPYRADPNSDKKESGRRSTSLELSYPRTPPGLSILFQWCWCCLKWWLDKCPFPMVLRWRSKREVRLDKTCSRCRLNQNKSDRNSGILGMLLWPAEWESQWVLFVSLEVIKVY